MRRIGVVTLLTLLALSLILNIAWCPERVWLFLWGFGGIAVLWILSGLIIFANKLHHDEGSLSIAELVYTGVAFVVFAPFLCMVAIHDAYTQKSWKWRI